MPRLFSLGDHFKPARDERDVRFDAALLYAAHLSFPDHMHGLVSPKGAPGTLKRKASQPWLDGSFDKTVILLDEVVQIFNLPQVAGVGKHSPAFGMGEHLGIGCMFINGDDAWSDRISGSQRLLENRLGGSSIPY